MAELFTALDTATASLEAQSPNAIAVSAGCNLFTKFVAQFNDHTRVSNFTNKSPPLLNISQDFEQQKAELVRQGRKYAQGARLYRDQIATSTLEFIQDDCVVRPLPFRFSAVYVSMSFLDLNPLILESRDASSASGPHSQTHIGPGH
jgi:hypothetical protein